MLVVQGQILWIQKKLLRTQKNWVSKNRLILKKPKIDRNLPTPLSCHVELVSRGVSSRSRDFPKDGFNSKLGSFDIQARWIIASWPGIILFNNKGEKEWEFVNMDKAPDRYKNPRYKKKAGTKKTTANP